MDETIQYHVIACDFYDNAKYHAFGSSCDGSLNLNLLGVQIKRAYRYIGSFSSWYYYPFFRLSPSFMTQKLVGVFFLIIFVATLMLLEEKNKISVMVIFGLSFPIIYQLTNDTGPVRYGIFMTVFTPLCVKFILRIRQNYIKIVLNIILGFMLFLAVEDKPFFLYFIPSIILLTIAYNHDENRPRITVYSIKFLLRQMWVSIMIFVSFTSFLLIAKTTSGEAYVSDLMKAVKPQTLTDALANLLSYMTNFQKFSSFVYDYHKFRLLNVLFSLSIWCYGFFFIAKIHKKGVNSLLPSKILFTSLALVVSIFVLLLMRNARTGHHFIYPYIFALLIVCQATSYETEGKAKFLVLYSFFSILLVIQLLLLVPRPQSSWERYKIFEYLKQETTARNYIIAHLSWGTYTIASLYGHKDQLSIDIPTWKSARGHEGISVDRKIAMEIMALSYRVKRRILCVCRGPDCNSEALFNIFLKKISFEEVHLANSDWKVYRERNRP